MLDLSIDILEKTTKKQEKFQAELHDDGQAKKIRKAFVRLVDKKQGKCYTYKRCCAI